MTSYEKSLAKAIRAINYFEVYGCSWKGNITKRAGKPVCCGHAHKTRDDCQACLTDMKEKRPGKCQTYRVCELQALVMNKEDDETSRLEDKPREEATA